MLRYTMERKTVERCDRCGQQMLGTIATIVEEGQDLRFKVGFRYHEKCLPFPCEQVE